MKRLMGMIVLVALAAVTLTATPATSRGGALCGLKTKLAGENEVPRGSSDATGRAKIKIWSDGTIRWKVRIKNEDLEGITAGHIHEAPAGVAGPVVVPLFAAASPLTAKKFRDRGTKTVTPELAADICADPTDYYVNYHSTQNPAGLARGQLG